MTINKIWFDDGRIYGMTDDGRTLWQSLLYFPRLMEANDSQRQNYTLSPFGIHWPEIDEDISFESFEYSHPDPEGISRLLLSLPEINLSALARRMGLQQSLLSAYKNGTKTPSKERENAILMEIHRIGAELQSITL